MATPSSPAIKCAPRSAGDLKDPSEVTITVCILPSFPCSFNSPDQWNFKLQSHILTSASRLQFCTREKLGSSGRAYSGLAAYCCPGHPLTGVVVGSWSILDRLHCNIPFISTGILAHVELEDIVGRALYSELDEQDECWWIRSRFQGCGLDCWGHSHTDTEHYSCRIMGGVPMHCLTVLPTQAYQWYVVFSTFSFCMQPFLSSFVIILGPRYTYMFINVLPYICNTCMLGHLLRTLFVVLGGAKWVRIKWS